jgi:type III restriction enzyme
LSPKRFPVCVKDKSFSIDISDTGYKERGKGMSDTDNIDFQLDLSDKDWYVYNENYGTSEEKYLVKFINNAIDDLKDNYDDIYLLRNERLFQIYNFSDGRPMEPDFVMFLREKESEDIILYQLFLEAKGGHLIPKEKWKEDFLKEIENEYKVLVIFENRDFKLYGLPFYNEKFRCEFEDKFKEILLQQ